MSYLDRIFIHMLDINATSPRRMCSQTFSRSVRSLVRSSIAIGSLRLKPLWPMHKMQNARSRRIMFQFVSDLTRCFFSFFLLLLAAAVGSLVVSQINCSSFLTDRRKLLNNSRSFLGAFSSRLSVSFTSLPFVKFLIKKKRKIEICF